MRRYITYMLGLMLSIATIGCVKTDDAPIEQQGVVKLQLASSIVATRAETPGNGDGVGEGGNDNNHNEDLIKTAQVFLFTENSAEAKVAYSSELITVTNNQLTLPLDNSQLDDLFPNNTGYAYVVANAQKIAATEDTTLANLKATKIVSTFASQTIQDSFVMDSERVALKREGNNVATNNNKPIYLTRAAAKIELTVNVLTSIEVGAQIWTPDTDNMTLQFFNGAETSVVDDGSDENAEDAQTATSYFNLSDDKARKFQTAESTDKTKYICTVVDSVTEVEGENVTTTTISPAPYYTYSTNWADASDKEPYFLLTIPWQVTKTDGKGLYQNYTYQIPIKSSALSLVRNSYYKLTLDVGVLGGQTEPVLVEPSYVVIDWGTNQVDVNLSRPKYLVVDENEVVMNNLTSYGVGYQSSDEVTAYIVGFKCQYYNNGSLVTVNKSTSASGSDNIPDNTTSISDVAPNLTNLTFTVKKENGKIVLEHNLDNTMPDKTYHYFPYEITVQVTNPALPGNPEIIVFKQYPAMYVDVYRQTSSTVMINGLSTTTGRDSWWYLSQNVGSTTTVFGDKSKDIFTVSVSAFDASTSQYIIGDPRALAADLTLHKFDEETGANSGNHGTYGDEAGNVEIKEYRATIVGADSENIIAPKFIMASGFGAHSLQSNVYPDTSGKYRCASYQEAGYPAGRWRVPTPAELQIIGKMCSEGKLESIFNDGTVYASSNGGYQYNSNGTFNKSTTTPKSVRCVYDVWYWGDKLQDDEITTFIWGAEGNIKDMKANGTYDDYFTPVQQ